MAKNITETVIKSMALDNQLISVVEDQGFLCHLEFLNPQYALSSRHYITFLPLSSYNVPVCAPVSWVSYSRACKQATEEQRNTRDIDKQHIHVILHDNIRNMKKAVDDREVPSVCCISHT